MKHDSNHLFEVWVYSCLCLLLTVLLVRDVFGIEECPVGQHCGPIETPAEPTEVTPAPPIFVAPDDNREEFNWFANREVFNYEALSFGLQTWESHYRACEEENVLLKAERARLEADLSLCPMIEEPPVVRCDVLTDFIDGPGNALWKPVSDNTRKPVFLLPREYFDGRKQILSADVLASSGVLIAAGRFRTCCPNGNRTHWDVPISAPELSRFAPITVQLLLADGTFECRIVQDPSVRND